MKYFFKITRSNEFKTYAKMINIKQTVFKNIHSKILLKGFLLTQKFLIRNAAGKCLKIKS
jgi:hypothetical protein